MTTRTELEEMFERGTQTFNRKCDLKVTRFSLVFNNVMPSQQEKLKNLCKSELHTFLENGSIISLALAYSEEEISVIDQEKKKWEFYANAYKELNQQLGILSEKIADLIQGIPLLPTIDGLVKKISHVREFFPLTISHRLIGELAGMGWRGKNNLIIHPQFSCAFRFTSVLTPLEFDYDQKLKQTCEDCIACYQVCSFLKKQTELKDYRENCRRYILHLDLGADVCGKCIKACYTMSKFKKKFDLS